MNVTCPECRSVFRVDPAKVPTGGVRARCAVCGGVMPVAAPAAFVGAPGDTPARSSVAIPPSGGWTRPTPPHAAAAARPATPASVTPASVTPAVVTPAVATPAAVTPPSATPAAATAPVWATPAAIPVAPPVPPAPPAPRAPTPAGTAAAGARPSGTTARTINPFLANDPNQKAKRLARALVSDIVAYHPQLRDEGMRDGTLKQLFRDEIKKSYEEYVDQVGKEFAEGTSHFQDALNEILAAGRKLF